MTQGGARDGVTRRHALRGAVATGVAVPVLAACADEEPTAGSDPSTTGGAEPSTGDGPAAGEPFASTADVAVGACAVYADEKVVVTQPSEGEFRAFSAVCTHQGCLVSSSSEGEIPCTCHFSRFSLEDGSVLEGPAQQPLPEVAIAVEGDEISLA